MFSEALWILAICGSIVFGFQFLMLVLGGFGDGADEISDVDVDGEADLDDGDGGIDMGFTLLSLKGLALLTMSVGWVGITLHDGFGLMPAITLPIAIVSGVVMVRVGAWSFRKMGKLASSGTVHLDQAVGEIGVVHLGVAPGKRGAVQVPVQGRLMTLDATSAEEELPTGTRIMVDYVDHDGLLTVSRARELGSA